MRLHKEVWGILWEFNSIAEYIAFTLGRIFGIIIIGIIIYIYFYKG